MWRDYPVKNEDLEPLAELIPAYCLPGLKNGDLSCSVVLNEDDEENPVVGVIIYRITGEDIEIEWVAPAQPYDLPEQGADMVWLFVNRARYAGGFRRLSALFREGDLMAHYFPEPAFIWTQEPDGVYRFKLSDVGSLGKQNKGIKTENCIALGRTDRALQNSLLAEADEHGTILPLPHPISWEEFDPEISAIYRGESGKAEGAILVSKENGELVIRLLYSENPVVVITLLEYAFGIASKDFGEEQEIVCPVLTEASETLVKKIVRDPQCREMIRAQIRIADDTGVFGNLIRFASEAQEKAADQ